MVKNDRRKEIINRIKKRNKMKGQHLHSRHEYNPFQPPSVTTYEANEEAGHPLFRKDILLLKTLIASLLFIGTAIVYRYPSDNIDPVRNVISTTMEQEIQFALVTDWYEETFGKPIAFLPSDRKDLNENVQQVSGAYDMPVQGKIIEDYVSNGTGIIVQTDNDKIAHAVQEGVVIFAGIKEGYGNTVIIQHPDRSESWYGNLQSIEVKDYAAVSKGAKLGGLAEDGTLFFGVKKGDMFIDPSQVMSFE